MKPLYTDEELKLEINGRAFPLMHLGLEEAYTVDQKDIVINTMKNIINEIEKSKEWIEE